MEKIRVIHIWKDFDTFYGVHDQLLSLARYIDKDLFDISICVFNYKGRSLGSEFEKLEVPVYNLKMGWEKNPLVIFKLVKFLNEKKPYIIQTYVLNTNIYGRIAGKLSCIFLNRVSLPILFLRHPKQKLCNLKNNLKPCSEDIINDLLLFLVSKRPGPSVSAQLV